MEQNVGMEQAVSRLVNDFFDYFIDEKDWRRLRGVNDKEFLIVEDLAGSNIVVYSCDREYEGHLVGMVSRRSLNKYTKTLNLLRYDKHVCYNRDPEAVFQKYRCPNCDPFFRKPSYLERHPMSCDERVKHSYPGGLYFIKKTIFDEPEGIGIAGTPENRLFKHLVIFEFESICKPRDENEWERKEWHHHVEQIWLSIPTTRFWLRSENSPSGKGAIRKNLLQEQWR